MEVWKLIGAICAVLLPVDLVVQSRVFYHHVDWERAAVFTKYFQYISMKKSVYFDSHFIVIGF